MNLQAHCNETRENEILYNVPNANSSESSSKDLPSQSSMTSHEDLSEIFDTIIPEDLDVQSTSSAILQAREFLTDRRIFDLFNFLIGHMIVDEPDEPIEYLHDLLDKCILFRSGLIEPPLLFDKRHIESVFQSLDPIGRGDISLDGYKIGMNTLGICLYDNEPRESTPGRVDKETFVNEAAD